MGYLFVARHVRDRGTDNPWYPFECINPTPPPHIASVHDIEGPFRDHKIRLGRLRELNAATIAKKRAATKAKREAEQKRLKGANE